MLNATRLIDALSSFSAGPYAALRMQAGKIPLVKLGTDGAVKPGALSPEHGRAVQVDAMGPMLKPSGTARLKPNHDKLLSNFAFNFNLRRYRTARAPPTPGSWR